MRVPVRSLATLLLAVGVATCADAPTVGRARLNPAKGGAGRGVIAMQPVFSKSASAVYAQRAAFAAATFDHVRIVLVRPGTVPPDTLRDTTIVFTPGSPPQTVEFTVDVASTNEPFFGAVDYTNNGQVVYHGEGTVISHPSDQPAPAGTEVVINYVGPGSNVARLTVAPKTVTIVAPGTATFTATAFDINNAPVANSPVSWSSSDPSVATISSGGVLSATGKRGVVTVQATSIAGPSDAAQATVTLPPAAIALVSGGGQTGKAGATLPVAAAVKVTASDGIGVSGITVTFAGPTGGGVGSSSVTTDANGNASTTMTLGGAVGAQSFAAVAGAFSVSIGATATPGDPFAINAVSGGGQSDTVKKALAGAFVAKVVDKFSNGVAGISVSWARTAGTGSLAGSSSTTAADGSTSMSYTLGTAPGAETVTATASGVNGAASFTVTALPAGPTNIAAVSGGGQTGRAQQPLGAPFVVAVTDVDGNPVSGATVNWSATNGTLSGSTATGTNGQASNTMTLGATVGAAAATATIGTAPNTKSVTFSATVQPGVVAQLVFRTGPPALTNAGAVLAPPIQVELRDAVGNLTAATNPVTIALGANPGTATLGGTLTVNAVAGVATFSNLTVSAAGVGYTLVVSSAGVPTVTSGAFAIGGGAIAGTWTGAVSSNWSTAGNWSNGAVPVPTDNVVIPAGTQNQPALATNVTINDLTVSAGAALTIAGATLTATGNVDATGGIAGGGQVQLTGANRTVRGTIPTVLIGASTSLSGTLNVPTTISILPSGSLVVANTMTALNFGVSGQLTVAAGGNLTVTTLSVGGVFSQTGGAITAGTAIFNGSSTTGGITGGTLTVTGSFTQSAQVSTASFAATGTHRTIFAGSGAQSITFASSAASGFHDVEIDGPGTVTLGSPFSANGQLISTTGANTVTGNANAMFVAGLSVDGLLLDNTLVVSTGGTLAQFDNVTFQNYAPTATPLTISHPGTASAITFNNTQFLVTPTSGSYVNVTDSNTGNGLVLSITLLNSVPGNGAAQTATSGGALVNWQVSGTLITWTSASSGLWSTPANWSLGRIPAAGDSVVIALAGTYTVTMNVNASVSYITLGAASGTQTLALTSATLTLSNVLTVKPNGILAPNSSTITGAGTIVNTGVINASYATIATALVNQSAANFNGTSAISGPLTLPSTSVLSLVPDNTTGFSNLTLSNNVTNNGVIQLTSLISTYSAVLSMPSATLTNAASGTIRSLPGTGGPRQLNVELNNQGTLTLTAPLTINRANAAHSNSGTIDASGGDLSLFQSGSPGTFTNTGTITIGATHTLTAQGGTFNQNAGSITGAGTWTLTSITANVATNFTNATTSLSLSSATVNGPATFTNAAGKTMTMFYSTFGANSSLDNQGTLISNGTSAINGTLTTAATSIIRLLPDNSTGFTNLTIANGFTNNGAIELSSAISTYSSVLTMTSGTLTNASGGTITSLAGSGGPRQLNAELNNQGTLTVAQPLTINRGNSAHQNSGTIDASAADLSLFQSGSPATFTNTGAITVGATHTFLVQGGTFNLNAGTIGGAGTWSLSSATANVATSFSNATTAFTLSSSTVNGPGTFTNASGKTLTLFYGTLGASLTLANQGLLIANGTSAINGTVTTTASSIIRLLPDNTTGFSSLTFANGFTNNGAIELSSAISTYSTVLNMTSGTLTNASGATITSLVGSGGPRQLNAELNNQGTLTVAQPLTINRGNSAHQNSGTIDASAGDLSLFQSGSPATFTNTGAITVGASHIFLVQGGTFNQNAGTIGGAGTWNLSSATANVATNFTNATTALNLSSSTVNGPGTFTNAAGKTMTLFYGTFGPTAVLDNQGLLIANGTSAINGTLTTTATSIIRLLPDNTTGFSNLTIGNGFTNNGAIELTSAISTYSSVLGMTSGTLTNAAAGTISVLAGTGGPRQLNAEINNQGTLTLTAPLTMNRANSAHQNSGTIDATAADLSLFQSGSPATFTNTGTLTVGATHTFTVSGGTFNQSAGAINGAGTMSLQSATVNFATNFTNATTGLTVSSSTVNGPGTFTNAPGKTLTLFYGTFGATATLVNQGLLVANGTSAINGTFTNTAASILRLLPDNTTGFSNLTFANGFTNNGGIELSSAISTYSSVLAVTAGTLTNAAGGTISSLLGSGGPRQLNAQMDNQGLVTVSQALTLNRTSSTYTNSGTINVSGGDLTVNQSGTTPSFTNTGTITVSAGRVLGISSGTFTQQTGATLNGGGAISLTSTTAAFNTGFTLGALTLSSSTASFQASLSTAATALNFLNSTINGPGTITNPTGQTLTMQSSTISASSGLTNQGTLIATGGSNILGPLVNASGALLQMQGNSTVGSSNLTVANGFTNNGAIELTSIASTYSEQLTVTNGTLTNASGATITSVVGTGGSRTINAQLDNQGTLAVNFPLTMSRTSTTYTNSGTINANADLTVNQSGTTPSFTNTGTVSVGAGQTWTINSGAFTQQTGATLNGGGALTLNSVNPAAFNTGFTLSALTLASTTASFANNLSTTALALSIASSTINGPGTITNPSGQTFLLQSSTIAATSALINQGTVIATGGNTINGPLTNASGALLQLQGNSSVGSSNLTVANGFTNNGAIELTSIASTYSEQLTVTNGTLTNASGATITSVVGTGGSRTINAQLDNQGTLAVNFALTMSRTATTYTNSGTINVNANLLVNQSGATPSFTNTGTITVAPSATWTISSGAFTQQTGATLNGGGGLTLTSVNPAAFNTGFTLGALTLSSTTASFANNLSTTALALSIASSTINGPGTITNPSGQGFFLQSSTIAATSALINQGTVIATGGNTINGPLTNASGALLQLQGNSSVGSSNLTVANGFTNNGAIELTSIASTYSEQLTVTNGTLTNASGATITSVVGTGGTRTISAQLDNQGTLNVNFPLTMNRTSTTYSNSGTINVNANLTVNQSGTTPTFTNAATGTIAVPSGQTFTITNGTLTHQSGGTLSGAGTLALSGVTANFNGGFTVGALNLTGNTNAALSAALSTATTALAITSATISGTATITNPAAVTTTLNAATLGSGITWVNQGTLISTGGTSIAGTFTTAAGSTLSVDASAGAANLSFSAGTGFTNNGAVQLTGTGGSAATITLFAGTLTNASGGSITSIDNGTGGRVISGSVNNLTGGVITIAQGGTGTLSITGTGAFTNAGTVNFKLNGTAAGQFDVLAVGGAATLGVGGPQGIMNVTLVAGFNPAAASTYNVMTYASHSQSFQTTNFPPGAWTAATNPTNITVTAP